MSETKVFVPFPGSLYFYGDPKDGRGQAQRFRPLSGVSLFLLHEPGYKELLVYVFVPFPGSLYFYPILYTHYKSRS